jgi:1-acyl-sn-glycerol-3-phosphate acyltransferase
VWAARVVEGRGVIGTASKIDLGGVEDATREPAREDTTTAEDAFGLDISFRERVAPAFRFLHERYWRVDVRGARNIPASGPALLVANHSGALPFDGAMISTSVDRYGRVTRFLYDRFVDVLGPVATFYRKTGGVAASRQNAVALLQAGQLVLVFPEGVQGVAKPFSDRYRLRQFHPGFAHMAMTLGVPVVPVAVVGAEEIYPLVGRVEGVGRLLGMPYLPITPFFPILGLLGTLPLPTKWFIRFGKPIRMAPASGEVALRRARVEAAAVRARIQGMLRRIRRGRRSVFLG